MILRRLLLPMVALWTFSSSIAQCLNGGCEVGLSRSQNDEGVFIGHYEDSKKSGLGITYKYNPKGSYTAYSNYELGKKEGVQYEIEKSVVEGTTIHTFTAHTAGIPIYPALQILKKDKKTQINVAFEEGGWQKYTGDTSKGNLSIKSIINEGTPAFLAINGKDMVMAVSATVSMIELLSSETTEKYYNALQVLSENDRLKVNIFPKVGADETAFVTDVDWDMQNPQNGTWVYRRYFNDKLSYKFFYEDVLALPSQQDVKQQKLQKAFDFITQQVDDYDFDRGYPGKAKDFIDMLRDIKERAVRKGLEIPSTYDIALVELYLRNGDEVNSLKHAKSACLKSEKSYAAITELLSTKLSQHSGMLDNIKVVEGIATSN